MGIVLKGKQAILDYTNQNGCIDLKKISISSLQYLLIEEKMSIKEIAQLLHASEFEVNQLLERNGVI